VDKTKLLKGIYTAGAVVLAGVIALKLVPASLDMEAHGALVYLLLHSWLPSAKTGAPQG
jgi:hypothetical protein